jgi:F0F1-type ATP synthase assembly protein I
MPPEPNDRRRWKPQYTELLNYSSVGIEMGAAVGIGVLIGWLLDRHFVSTSPWLTMLFMALGIAAAGRAFYRTAKELRDKQRQGEDEKRPE